MQDRESDQRGTGVCSCGSTGGQWDINCDLCCVRKVLEMPDRAHRRQVLHAVKMRRGGAVAKRVRGLVEMAWKQKEDR